MKSLLIAVMFVLVGLTWSCAPKPSDCNCHEAKCSNCNCDCCDQAETGVNIFLSSDDERVFDLPAWVTISRIDEASDLYLETVVEEFEATLQNNYYYDLEPGKYTINIYYSAWQEPVFWGDESFLVKEGQVTSKDVWLETFRIMTWNIEQSPLDNCNPVVPGHLIPLWTFKLRHDWDEPDVSDDQEGLNPWSLGFKIVSTENVTVGNCWVELAILGGWQTISEPNPGYCIDQNCGYYSFQENVNFYTVPVYPGMGNSYRISCDLNYSYDGNAAIVRASMESFSGETPSGVLWTTKGLPAYGCDRHF